MKRHLGANAIEDWNVSEEYLYFTITKLFGIINKSSLPQLDYQKKNMEVYLVLL